MKLSEEYFEKRISTQDYPNQSDTLTYGLIRDIEGKIEELERIQNTYEGYQDIRTKELLFRDNINPRLVFLRNQLVQIKNNLEL